MQIHTLKGYIQHIFLVREGDRLLLLDGCGRADIPMVCQFIEHTLQLPLSALKLIVVTHMHPDHAGGAHRLRALSGAQIASHPKASAWYAGLSGRIAHAVDVALMYWVAKRLGKPRKNGWYSPILKPDLILEDEQRLPGFSDWQVLYTPGHTDHDLSLRHVPGGEMYVADLLVQVKGQLRPPYPICHPNQYRRSLQRVAALPVASLLMAHVPTRPMASIPFEQIISDAPVLPKNHWYATKDRLVRKLGWGR
ncbi:MBL fold metallo-hydrolase [Salinimonas lutimaris]|uniref:MBL fold metallo-hydrolase n=1 Tax=Salinimonas lutimaris TaxID=914153 RepID=UPI0010C15112|nr:MBL fold metallo-hydrolase [Salinimonas lutimaris]